MLLIYTQKITPRITYTFKHICTRILGVSVGFTSKIEEFVAHEGMKLSYGRKRLGGEIFVQQDELLVEQGMGDVEIKMGDWDGTPCFFKVSEDSSIPFDIFAASFYLLTRYEEFFPHVKDEGGRFPATESLGYQEDFLHLPVVDMWAYKFRKVLEEHYDLKFARRKFKAETIISVTEAYRFRKKGIVRSALGFLSDLFQLKVKYAVDRVRVLLKLKKDPYDNYGIIVKFLKKYKVPLKFMFQVSSFSTYDRNVNPNRYEFQSLIKSMADYAEVGLQPGYYACQYSEPLKQEKQRLEDILKRPVESGLNHRYNLLLPDQYMNMAELEFRNDYSMGYPKALGFRAGTCTPYLFYDINLEVTLPILIHPFAINMQAVDRILSSDVEMAIDELLKETRQVEGTLTAIFSNEDFSEYRNARRNYAILKQIHEIK